MKKQLLKSWRFSLLIASFVFLASTVKIKAQVITTNQTGTNNGFYYSFWNAGGGTVSMTLGAGGNYSTTWTNCNNFTAGKGWATGSASRSVTFSGSFDGGNNGYLALYGWTRSPLIEYYVVENYGSWTPPGGTSLGTFTSDGGTYNLYKMTRTCAPSIDGNCSDFSQYWSVRTTKRSSGTVTFANHVNAWKSKGMNMGTSWDYQIIETEGYQSSGSSNITVSEGVNNIPVSGVTMAPTTSTIALAGTTQLTATIAPSNATNQSVSWSSSNTSVATVSATGLVTGVSVGSATITVTTTDGSKTATCAVTVSNITVPVTGVTVAPATASVNVGATSQLTATIAPANASNKTISWTSSSTAIATVSATGLVTGVAAGSATITVTTLDGVFTATCAVTVTPVNSSCSFGAPLAAGLPTTNKSFNYVYVLGTGGPNLSNVGNFTINWDLPNKGLWQFSMNTKDGKPNWYVDLRTGATQTFASAQPSITLSGTGFAGLDGSYYAATDNGNFVLVSKTGGFTIYFSSSATAPVCTKSAKVETSSVQVDDNSIQLYPNPFTESINIRLGNTNEVNSIYVIDELGRILISLEKSSITSDMSIGNNLKSGIYFLRIQTSNGAKSYLINKK